MGFLFHINGRLLSMWPDPEPLLPAAHFKTISRRMDGHVASPISERLGKVGVLGTSVFASSGRRAMFLPQPAAACPRYAQGHLWQGQLHPCWLDSPTWDALSCTVRAICCGPLLLPRLAYSLSAQGLSTKMPNCPDTQREGRS